MIVCLDFESEAIEPYPAFPPTPVGLSVEFEGRPPVYLGWGHPTNNNCDRSVAEDFLKQIWTHPDATLLFHNGAGFDIPLAMEHFGLPPLPPERWEDTMFSLFLVEPLAPTLSLKPSAQRILNMPPTEQDEVRHWLIDAGIVRENDKNWGAHIAKAPGDLVGRYAQGDTHRTLLMHQHLYPALEAGSMLEPYRREKALAPILYKNSKRGMRIDRKRLERDAYQYEIELVRADKAVHRIIGECNIDSPGELAEALKRSGKADEINWPRTPTGKLSTARGALLGVIADNKLAVILTYRNCLHTALTTFIRPWLTMSADGYLHPNWNQVRGDAGGARTGRLSCSMPNFQNVVKEWEGIVVPKGFLPLPLMREYLLPDEGEEFVSVDYHSQEIRILGHFAEGAIMDIYKRNPSADVHQAASDLIKSQTGLELTRRHVKIIGFSILYGAGITRLADSLGVDRATAATFKNAYLGTLTGVKEFQWDVEGRAQQHQPVRTWGKRLMYAPPPSVGPQGQMWDRNYVLVNYLIQGSAADQTKQAMVDYDSARKHGRMLATVHDELCFSIPKAKLKSEIEIIREVMETQPGWDIPTRVEVKRGPNWQSVK